MYVGIKRSPEKVIGLWIVSFGLYGIYWLAQTFSELQKYRKQGISGGSYALLAVIFPPLALSACWLLPSYVGKLYEENGKYEEIGSYWGSILFLPSLALWAVVGMSYLIVIAGGGMGENGMTTMYMIVSAAIGINLFLLYNWLQKIQVQMNEFWDEAEKA
ncbi:DUF4234 domain-containing protein [Sulfurimonas sp. MAG313]|nr:DUF4234 domain-containing protein [Sulfurimonas sp. MAG313]MDF1880823.1 DUF4234 domain-containing protein [Sulfurimonas sp. MAG313]